MILNHRPMWPSSSYLSPHTIDPDTGNTSTWLDTDSRIKAITSSHTHFSTPAGFRVDIISLPVFSLSLIYHMTSIFRHEALFSFNFYPRHVCQGCKDQRHQMAPPCLWVGFILWQTAFLKMSTTDTTPRDSGAEEVSTESGQRWESGHVY